MWEIRHKDSGEVLATGEQRRMEGIDLSDANLAGADLRGVSLKQCILRGADLRGADFAGARLKLVDMDDAKLDGASFASATVDGIRAWRATATGLNLEGTRCHGRAFDVFTVVWPIATVVGMLGSIANDIGFLSAGRSNPDRSFFFLALILIGTYRQRMATKNKKRDKALMRPTRESMPYAADFSEADLTGSNWSGLRLVSGQIALNKADLSGANISGIDFRDSILSHAVLLAADLKEACFQKTTMDGVNLTGAALTGPDGPASLPRQLFAAELSGTVLAGANLVSAELGRANLTECNLQGANLSNANMAHSVLAGADLRGADLRGALLADVSVGSAQFDHNTKWPAGFNRAKHGLPFENAAAAIEAMPIRRM